MTPDSVHDIQLTVPVTIYTDDASQQLVCTPCHCLQLNSAHLYTCVHTLRVYVYSGYLWQVHMSGLVYAS